MFRAGGAAEMSGEAKKLRSETTGTNQRHSPRPGVALSFWRGRSLQRSIADRRKPEDSSIVEHELIYSQEVLPNESDPSHSMGGSMLKYAS